MMQLDVPQDLVIATGETRSLEAFVAEAFALHDLHWQAHVEISPALFRPTDIPVSRADPSRAAGTIQWCARNRMADVVRLMSNGISN
jgi:GDPmannose 4,6-dehydratase